MKKLLAVLVVVCAVANLGCEPPSAKMQDQPRISGPSKPDEAAEFPEIMVGVWEAETSVKGSKWGIKFESDGSIRKIIHSFAGPINVSEGGVMLEGPEEDTFLLLILENCQAKYEPETDTLKVNIFIDHYVMRLPNGELQGHIKDYFSGPVSKDGKTWKVKWRNHMWLDGSAPPPIDIIDANPVELLFTKLDIK